MAPRTRAETGVADDAAPHPARRIVVGLDGSAGARDALRWAVLIAARRGATVLAVTAWPDAPRARSRRSGRLSVDRAALARMQAAQIEAATAGLPHPPPVGRELVLADPVTALCHGAAMADLVVLGAHRTGQGGSCAPVLGRCPHRVATQLAARLATPKAHGRPAPPVVVAGSAVAERSDPPGRDLWPCPDRVAS